MKTNVAGGCGISFGASCMTCHCREPVHRRTGHLCANTTIPVRRRTPAPSYLSPLMESPNFNNGYSPKPGTVALATYKPRSNDRPRSKATPAQAGRKVSQRTRTMEMANHSGETTSEVTPRGHGVVVLVRCETRSDSRLIGLWLVGARSQSLFRISRSEGVRAGWAYFNRSASRPETTRHAVRRTSKIWR